MTLQELATRLEMMDEEEIIYCYVENESIIASFSTREDVTVNVLTPYEKMLLDKDKFIDEDIIRKYSELKAIANNN